MKIGTKSVLFGIHAFWLHPFIVLIAWLIIWKKWPAFAELMAILTHDLGYWGAPNMDGTEGRLHPQRGALFWSNRFGVFGDKVADIILGHSRFYTEGTGLPLSRLFRPDKLATALYPKWLYLLLGNLSSEIKEYMELYRANDPTRRKNKQNQIQWLVELQGNMALMGIYGIKHHTTSNRVKKYTNTDKIALKKRGGE